MVDISGTITSVASFSNNFMVSTSRDRFLRLHSTVPPGELGRPLESKGDVLGSVFLHSTPTTVTWDPHTLNLSSDDVESNQSDDDIWEGLETVDEMDGPGMNRS